MKIAVFDIGTNSIHMLVVEIHPDLSFEIIDHEKDVTRLGDGSFETKLLAKPVMNRALEMVERFHKIAKKSQVRRVLAVATSAVREARNGGEFIETVRKRTGIKVNVVTGEEEGRLIALAAKASIETAGRDVLVIDIGGGSVELIHGNIRENRSIDSFKLGIARLTDHFLHADPPSKKDISRMEAFIRHELKKKAKKLRKAGFAMVIGTGGTMINLGAIVHHMKHHRPLELVNHFELTEKALEEVEKKLAKTDLKQRLKIPGLDPKRADIIVAGGVLVCTLMKLLRADKITLSDKGIREGVVLDFIEKNKKKLKGEEEGANIREKSVLQLARRCSYEEKHAAQVACLAESLFDQTQSLHSFGPKERELLRYASLLHDIGHYVSFRRHHRHGYYLVVNSELDGFSPEEVEILAALVRYHRKGLPRKDDEELARIAKPNRRAVKALGAILRIADGLDRSHFSVVKSLDCRVHSKSVTLTVRASQDTEIERWQAQERADLFEEVFKRKVIIQPGIPGKAK